MSKENINYAADFLKVKTVEDACKNVKGEMLEVCTYLATYFYGNREVIVSPKDENEKEFTMFVDIYGDKKYLVEA